MLLDSHARRRAPAVSDPLVFSLDYRPPYAWGAMLDFLGTRAIAGVELRDGEAFRRAISLFHQATSHTGWIEVRASDCRDALSVSVSASLSRVVPEVLAKVRHVFDLASDPAVIARGLGPLAASSPGLRLPGAFDGFETGVRAITGQQVSVRAMMTLLSRIASRYGTPLASPSGGLAVTFPDAVTLSQVPAASIAAIGMPRSRAQTIATLARAVVDGLDLTPGADVDATLAHLLGLPGIGPWTAQYIAMRALGWHDAFLHTDLGVKRALGETNPARILALAERWRPWRAYAVIHLWNGHKGDTT